MEGNKEKGKGMKAEGRNLRRCFLPSALCLLPFIIVCPTFAQPNISDNSQNVFIRDSSIAADKLALAQRMERLQEWDKAAEAYQDIIVNHADGVLPSEIDKNNRYTSVIPVVQDHLYKWPVEALTIYRSRYETEAAALLETAGDDPGKLVRVLNLYFPTDSARKAGLHLIDLDMEQGEFFAAHWIAQQLLDRHRFLEQDRPRLLFRAALAAHFAGDDRQAAGHLKELTDKFPQATAWVNGAEVNLAQALGQRLGAGETIVRQYPPETWPIAFGDAQRSRIPQISAYGGARLFAMELERPSLKAVQAMNRTNAATEITSDISSGLMTGIFPVVDRGEMFFQDNCHVYAVNLESGAPLPGWAQTYDGDRNGRYTINAWAMPKGNQSTVTLTDDSVLAVMGEPDIASMSYTGIYGIRDTRLVCLDRRTGKQKWVVMPKEFTGPAAPLHYLDLNGSPLVVGDAVYIQGRGGKGMQFEDSYVLAFDLATGKFRWACYVASANTGSQSWQSDQAILGQNNTHLAYSNGRIFALTNLGAVAAIDAYDGSIVWIDLYPRNFQDLARFNGRVGRGLNGLRFQANANNIGRPWIYNPVIISQGKAFVMPHDGTYVHIYDCDSGEIVKNIPMNMWVEQSDTLLGVVGEKLLVNSQRRVFCIDWRNYDEKRGEANLLWTSVQFSIGNPVMGRGFVTADSVLVPTKQRLYRIKLDGGALAQQYPGGDDQSWPDDEGPGNLLVTQDRLIITGATASGVPCVNVYTDLSMATAKLDAAIAAAPDDPSLRLRYADILFAAGKIEAAIGKLDEAVGLMGSGSRGNSNRARIFDAALLYAAKLSKTAEPPPELVNGLFDRASAAATSPSQKVDLRLKRAAYVKSRLLPDQEIKLYQQILTDVALRQVPVDQGDDDMIAAGELAKKNIDDVKSRAGDPVYAPFERMAADMLLAAARDNDPNQLQSVAAVYPNSTSAPRALLLAADVYENAGDAKMAVQLLRQAYFRFPASTERDRIIESLARNLLRLPNRIDAAIARLNQGAGVNAPEAPRLTRPMLLPDGRKLERVTFAEAAETLKQIRAKSVGKDLPDIALVAVGGNRPRGQAVPVFRPEDPATTIRNVGKLLIPPLEQSRNDRVITFTNGVGVRIFAVGQSTPIITSDAVTDEIPFGAAWVGEQAAVWSGSKIMVLSPERAQLAWALSLKTLTAPEVVAAAEPSPAKPGAEPPDVRIPQLQRQGFRNGRDFIEGPGPAIVIGRGGQMQFINVPARPPAPAPDSPRVTVEQFKQVRALADRVIATTNMGRVIAFELSSGKLLWQARLGDRDPAALLATDDFVVVRMNDDNNINVVLAVLDAFSGQLITRRTFGVDANENSNLRNVALASNGTLVWLTDDRIYSKDLFERDGLEKPSHTYPARPGELGFGTFQQSTWPEHLLIEGDKVIVTSVQDQSGSTLRVLSLRDLSPVRAGGIETVLRLDQTTLLSPFFVRVVGTSMYVATSREVKKIDLEKGSGWPSGYPDRTSLSIRDLVVTRGHLVALTEPTPPQMRQRGMPDGAAQSLKLNAFSRAVTARGDESGLFEHYFELANGNRRIVSWQFVDGGLYFLDATDMKLHFLHGASE